MSQGARPVTPAGSDVTIVIPAYNAGTMIDTALASIAGQTVQPQAVIVVDDGSTDDTADRAERWTGRLPIEVRRVTPNGGIGAASAVAVARVRTPLVAHLDADDALLPDHLEVMLATFGRHGGVVTTQELAWIPAVAMRTATSTGRAVPRRPSSGAPSSTTTSCSPGRSTPAPTTSTPAATATSATVRTGTCGSA